MRPLLVAVISCLLLLAGACRPHDSVPATPPAVSLWYWHTPFVLTPGESKILKSMKVSELFVRTATLYYSGDMAKPVQASLPQTWKSRPTDIKIHLVFPIDRSLVRHFETTSVDVFADGIVSVMQTERKRAEKADIAIAGVQMDLDCPTRLLPRYALLLKRIRARIGLPLSITLLSSWYDSRSIATVLDTVDFSVPQFYEAETFAARQQFHSLSNLGRMERGLQKAERLGRPFYAGLPVYGHALVYDGQGKLRGLFHDASAAELFNRPKEFHLLAVSPLTQKTQVATKSDDFIGEETVEFGPVPKKADFRLLYDLPTPELLERHLKLYQKINPSHCRGIILYHLPQAGEEAALPLTAIESVLQGNKPKPQLNITFRTRRHAPYEMVEAVKPADASNLTDLYVTVINTGDSAVRVAPRSVAITLRFDRPVMDSVAPGSFEGWEAFAGLPTNRASVPRADGLRLFTAHFAPGERRVFGPISLLSGGPVNLQAEWQATLPGGFETATGQLPTTPVPVAEKE